METITKSICPDCNHHRNKYLRRFHYACEHPSNTKFNYTTGMHVPQKSLKELNSNGDCKKFEQMPTPPKERPSKLTPVSLPGTITAMASAPVEQKKPNWITRIFSFIVRRVQ